jgi:cytochrome c-type biogenesis protein
MSSVLVFAFTAGAVSTVNPCGFALLPAWFARQLAGREGDGGAARFLRASANAVAAALGYVITFLAATLVLGSGANWLGPTLPYAGVTIGVALVVWGFLALADLRLPATRLTATCRRANERFGALGFGLSYGFVSLSCTLPIFMAVAGVSFLGNNDLALQNVLFFLLGSGAILATISVVASVLGAGVFQMIGRHHASLRRVAGGLTTLAGGYVFLYWGQVLFGDAPWMRAILDTGGYWAAMLNQFLSEGAGLIAALVALLGISTAASVMLWRKRATRASSDTSKSAPLNH